jgi:hypothetical protein
MRQVHGVTRPLGRTNLAWPPLTLLAGYAEGSQHTWHLSDVILGLTRKIWYSSIRYLIVE